MKKIFVNIPNQGWLRKELTKFLMGAAADSRFDLTFFFPDLSPVENSMHHAFSFFREKGDWDAFLSLDADNPPMRRNPLELVELDKDIIGCPTPIWSFAWDNGGQEVPLHWNVYGYNKEADNFSPWQTCSGLQEVDGVGFGCILIQRRVLVHPEMQKAPCQRIWKEDGTVYRGLDLAFCCRAKANGFKVYAHFEYPCSHFKEVDLVQFNLVASSLISRGNPKQQVAGQYKAPKRWRRKRKLTEAGKA